MPAITAGRIIVLTTRYLHSGWMIVHLCFGMWVGGQQPAGFTVTGNVYLDMLQNFIVDQLPPGPVFQQDGATPLDHQRVREFLDEKFPDRHAKEREVLADGSTVSSKKMNRSGHRCGNKERSKRKIRTIDPDMNKPEIVSFYNLMNGGVHSLDKKCANCSTSHLGHSGLTDITLAVGSEHREFKIGRGRCILKDDKALGMNSSEKEGKLGGNWAKSSFKELEKEVPVGVKCEQQVEVTKEVKVAPGGWHEVNQPNVKTLAAAE
ncbi:hypothetical protein ANN_03142 [Periplaneta americana]|uniref:Uncharacterized protein n=1 Tax=Periplaneta americana TaxID=6978 RepID=A0ABQ8TZW5_PERAM|nr:hypothetical protein ANN_03142 [Periplaneta americana]